MSNQKKFLSLKDWCIENNREDFLELWDYNLNDSTPEKIAHMSTKKVWLKCSRGIHKSTHVVLQSVIKAYKNGRDYKYCSECNSLGMYIIDKFGDDYLNAIWSKKNKLSPFAYTRKSGKKIWLHCLNDEGHPDYEIIVSNFEKTHNCPYCAGKKVCQINSLGHKKKKSFEVWSQMNNKSPYDYTISSNEEVWWVCENGIHENYKRPIYRAVDCNFRCPACSRKTFALKGEKHPYWKGGVTTEAQSMRKSPEYDKWRLSVYEKDKYTCQCCGKVSGRLTAHHINDYATHIEDRFLILNGITLCFNHHDSTVNGSFHNEYGTHGKTAKELEEYINKKRIELGIPIPFSIESYIEGFILKPNSIQEAIEFYRNWPLENVRFGPLRSLVINDRVKILPRHRANNNLSIKEDQ